MPSKDFRVYLNGPSLEISEVYADALKVKQDFPLMGSGLHPFLERLPVSFLWNTGFVHPLALWSFEGHGRILIRQDSIDSTTWFE